MELKSLRTLKVLVVDDTLLYRDLIAHMVNDIGGAVVVGKAVNGQHALELTESLQPDAITLDVEMPVMNGIDTLVELRKKYPKVKVLMVSALTKNGAAVTIDALSKGAVDFICKPNSGSVGENQRVLVTQLDEKLRPIIRSHQVSGLKANGVGTLQNGAQAMQPAPQYAATNAATAVKALLGQSIKLVAIGASTGGPSALATLLETLPEGLKVPIVIVQHMPELFTAELARNLDKRCKLTVVEASDGQILQAGTVYIAPGGKHMKLHNVASGMMVKLTLDPPENFCRPAVDYLFRSVAENFRDKALGIVLTGMGSDGSEGLREMKNQGALTIAQDEASCVVFGMPKEAIQKGVIDLVLPLQEMSRHICKVLQ